jgi:hypothetical protein
MHLLANIFNPPHDGRKVFEDDFAEFISPLRKLPTPLLQIAHAVVSVVFVVFATLRLVVALLETPLIPFPFAFNYHTGQDDVKISSPIAFRNFFIVYTDLYSVFSYSPFTKIYTCLYTPNPSSV